MGEPKILSGIGITHDGCNYAAPLYQVDSGGQFWFCEKCGQIGKQPAPGASGGTEGTTDG